LASSAQRLARTLDGGQVPRHHAWGELDSLGGIAPAGGGLKSDQCGRVKGVNEDGSAIVEWAHGRARLTCRVMPPADVGGAGSTILPLSIGATPARRAYTLGDLDYQTAVPAVTS